MNILLIDDDEVDRLRINRLIEAKDNGSTVVSAATAEEGLALFEQASFDIVLLDLLLPDMDGLDVLAMLRANKRHRAAVIILTGGTDEQREFQCMEAGAQDFLLKDEVSDARLRRALLHARIRYQLESKISEHTALLEQYASQDSLTQIGNRRCFTESLASVGARSLRERTSYALFVMDVDNFKSLNDNMGYSVGDRFLTEIARRLSDFLDHGDVVCRLGGDEFALICIGLANQAEIEECAARLLATLSRPIRLHNVDYSVSLSIGAALNDATISSDELLTHATTALKHAKRSGKGCFVLFSQGHREALAWRQELSFDLGLCETEAQFEVYYQPLLCAETLRVVGAEALLRWNHPMHGTLPPGYFIEIAKDIGSMDRLDALVRRRACQQLAAWRNDRTVSEDFKVACNSCAATLMQAGFGEAVLRDIVDARLPCHCLEIEVTEDDLITDFNSTSVQLAKLRAEGVSISIDDFGTGYSSMSYLKSLPSSRLKVDRSFLKNVPMEESDNRILRAITTMAKSLALDITIEGIETADQVNFCRAMATTLQGHYFAQPMPADQFAAFMRGSETAAETWSRQIAAAGDIADAQPARPVLSNPSNAQRARPCRPH